MLLLQRKCQSVLRVIFFFLMQIQFQISKPVRSWHTNTNCWSWRPSMTFTHLWLHPHVQRCLLYKYSSSYTPYLQISDQFSDLVQSAWLHFFSTCAAFLPCPKPPNIRHNLGALGKCVLIYVCPLSPFSSGSSPGNPAGSPVFFQFVNARAACEVMWAAVWSTGL